MSRTSIWLIVLTLASAQAVADPPRAQSESETANIEAALRLTSDAAKEYEFVLRGSSRSLTHREQPVLRWSNPERGQIYGNVFLWTHAGRPQVVGSLFKWFSPFTHMSHEFCSLSSTELAGRFRTNEVWRTSSPGISFALLPDAPAVARSAAQRLIQMRQIARRFTGRETTREGDQLELRLLSQPVYRYEIPEGHGELADGGLFVFVQGTDPEIWLLLETDPQKSDALQDAEKAIWHYALAPMNSVELAVQCDGQEVWHQDIVPWAKISSHRETYTSFMFK